MQTKSRRSQSLIARAFDHHSPLPLQGEASVGSSSARHVVNAAAGRSKNKPREKSEDVKEHWPCHRTCGDPKCVG
jgi:hypothetical protein